MKYFGTTGGIIAAASPKSAEPLKMVGSIPVVKRIVLTLQQANVFPIVIVTGTRESEIIHQIANSGVIFLHIDNCEQLELLTSLKRGLVYLKNKCQRVVFTPVNTPMFFPSTLKAILSCDAPIVAPSCHGRGGHPIMLRHDMWDRILAYVGNDGLRGAIDTYGISRRWVPVEDEGVLLNVHNNEEQVKRHLKAHNDSLLSPVIKVNIESEQIIFNARLKLLLFLIADLSSVRQACIHMGLSYAKAWNMINCLEKEVGYPIVSRQHGGSKGGHTKLTDKGEQLMRAYQVYEQELNDIAQARFETLFRQTSLI